MSSGGSDGGQNCKGGKHRIMKICSSGERETKLMRTIDYWEVYIANLKLRASGPGKISQILNLCIFKVCIEKNERK